MLYYLSEAKVGTSTKPIVHISTLTCDDSNLILYREIVKLLSRTADAASEGQSDDPTCNDDNGPLTSEDEPLPFTFAHHEQSIRESGAYEWLLSKIRHHDQLSWGSPNSMSKIGREIRNQLCAHNPLSRRSLQRSLATVTMTFKLDFSPRDFLLEKCPKFEPIVAMRTMRGLTGTLREAQCMTTAEYMAQTWPETGERFLEFMAGLVSLPEGDDSSHFLMGKTLSLYRAKEYCCKSNLE